MSRGQSKGDQPEEELVLGTRYAYHHRHGVWEYEFEFEAPFFEDLDPPSYVVYAKLWLDGVRIGTLDIVTRIRIVDLPGGETNWC